jgi:hypothetical protein
LDSLSSESLNGFGVDEKPSSELARCCSIRNNPRLHHRTRLEQEGGAKYLLALGCTWAKNGGPEISVHPTSDAPCNQSGQHGSYLEKKKKRSATPSNG